jgi:geranylgeranyl diphosphate synthase type I
LSQRLDELLGGRELPALGQAMRDYVLAGGKRIRPQLVAWTWRHARGDAGGPLPVTLLDLAVAWEIFHAFLLVHDDIIDGADARRDQPALHRRLALLDSNCPRFGTNLGIVAGDLLFTASMKLWHSLDLPIELFRAELKLFSRIAELTGYGQAIDIVQGHVPLDHVDEATLLLEYHWKTAAYTFEGPMLSAAIAAGLDDRQQATLSRFALGIGQAYQLQNDLLDLAVPCHEGSDLVQGKRTVTIVRHRASLDPRERRAMDERISAIATGNGHALDLAEQFRRDLLETPALARTRELVDELLAQADEAASDASLEEPLRAGLHDLLERLRASYFAAA